MRAIQRVLKERGIPFTLVADEKTDGPAFFQITDPDGYPILVDQHVDKPKRWAEGTVGLDDAAGDEPCS